jgi:hypothetical protein
MTFPQYQNTRVLAFDYTMQAYDVDISAGSIDCADAASGGGKRIPISDRGSREIANETLSPGVAVRIMAPGG